MTINLDHTMRFSFLKIHVAFVNIFNIQDNYMFQSTKRRLLLNEGSSAPWARPSFNNLQQMNIRLEEVRQTMTTAVNEKQNESLQDAPVSLNSEWWVPLRLKKLATCPGTLEYKSVEAFVSVFTKRASLPFTVLPFHT